MNAPLALTASLMALGIAVTPAAAQTRSPESAHDSAADQRLAAEKAETRAAYRSGDKKRIAAERGELRQAYGADWKSDHVNTHRAALADRRADNHLNAERERTRLAYKSGDKKRIAAERQRLGQAYSRDNQADKRVGESGANDRDPR